MKVMKPIHRIVGYKEEDVLVKCPWCGSDDMKQVDEEMVECNACHHKTDMFEAMKQAEVHGGQDESSNHGSQETIIP